MTDRENTTLTLKHAKATLEVNDHRAGRRVLREAFICAFVAGLCSGVALMCLLTGYWIAALGNLVMAILNAICAIYEDR